MARDFELRHFFRNVPNKYLKRYFSEKEVLQDFDFDSIKETKVGPLFDAFCSLEQELRNDIEAEFHDIFEMGCQKAVQDLIDDFDSSDREEIINLVSSHKSPLTSSMVFFLDYKDYWENAFKFFAAESFSHSTKIKNIGNKPVLSSKNNLDLFVDRISQYFSKQEGRGKNCSVEYLRRNDLEYFFIYQEDYSSKILEWGEKSYRHNLHRPVLPILLVYSQDFGYLDIYFKGKTKTRNNIRDIFCFTLLGFEKLPNFNAKKAYKLESFKNKNFKFNLGKDLAIKKAYISRMTFVKNDAVISIKVEEDCIYKALERSLKLVEPERIGEPYRMKLLSIEVKGIITQGYKENNKKFSFALREESCTLKYNRRDLKLRKMLERSNVDELEVPTLEKK